MRAAKAPNGRTGANRWMSHACVKGCDEPCVRGHRSARILQWTLVAILLQIPKAVGSSTAARDRDAPRGVWGIATSGKRRAGEPGCPVSTTPFPEVAKRTQRKLGPKLWPNLWPKLRPKLWPKLRSAPHSICGSCLGLRPMDQGRLGSSLRFTRQRADLFPRCARAYMSWRRKSTEVVTSMSTCLKIAVAAALLVAAAAIAVKPPTSRWEDDGSEQMSSSPRLLRPSEAGMFKRD